MKIFSIYKITNNSNGKSYIGWTSKLPNRRFKDHLYESNERNSQYTIHKAIRKYGESNFDFEVICQSKDGKYLLEEMEPYFIKKYDSFGPNGYNMTLGGEGGMSGRTHTKEAKKKQQLAHIGKIMSDATKKKLRRPKSESFKEQVRKTMLDNNIKNYIIYFDDSRVLNLHDNLYVFAKQNGYDYGCLCAVIRQDRRRHKNIIRIEKLSIFTY